jgi:Heterokaryon incompatibility protein (HET)
MTAELERSFKLRRIRELGPIVRDRYFVLARDYAFEELDESQLQTMSSPKAVTGPNDPELRFDTAYKPDWPLTARNDMAGICRNVFSSPMSRGCLEIARRWLGTCQQQHLGCSRKESTPLPTRVIDIGPQGSHSRPHLHVTNSESAPYITLSYCWGGDVPSKTISTNFERYLDGLEISELPKTFKDAILLTRELGFRYLWIDALCIIQDDVGDWEREAAVMGTVYSNSVFTISALSSYTSSEGFLDERPPKTMKSVGIGYHQISESKEWSNLSVRKIERTHFDYCLSYRGWTLQERLLPAAVLHYTPEGMIWECRTHCVWEHGEGHPTSGMLKAMSYFTGVVDMDFLWQRAVQDYSCRALAVEGDKLPAIAGVAQYFKSIRSESDEYLAGIWKDTIPESLRWIAYEGTTVPQPSGYRAPSWSWAAVNGRVEWLIETSNEMPIDDLGFQLLDVEVEVRPPGSMGRVVSGYLDIYGVLRECFLEHQDQWNGKLHVEKEQTCICWTDCEVGSRNCFALALGLWRFLCGGVNHQHQVEDQYRIWYLVVERVSEGHDVSGDTSEDEEDIAPEFKRLGIAYVDFEDLPSLPELEPTLLRVI